MTADSMKLPLCFDVNFSDKIQGKTFNFNTGYGSYINPTFNLRITLIDLSLIIMIMDNMQICQCH